MGGERITVGNIKTMVDAINAVQDAQVNKFAKDYEWHSHSAPRLYTLTRGGKIIIQGMRAADFYFACNAIAETINDVIANLPIGAHLHALAKEGYHVAK